MIKREQDEELKRREARKMERVKGRERGEGNRKMMAGVDIG
jgi:hypothetical protein